MFVKFHATQQLLKSDDLFRESGDGVDESWPHVLHLMLNLQQEHNDSESEFHYIIKFVFNSTTLKISTFVNGVW